MNRYLIILMILGLMACGKPAAKNPESIKKEIQKTKQEIGKLEKKVKDLKLKLKANYPEEEKATLLVKTKTMKYETFEHSFIANGSIEAVREAMVGAELSGRVQTIHVKEGQRIQEGDLLVTLNSSIIENNLAEVRTSSKLARTVYEKRKRLWDKKIGSELEFLQAKNAKESLEDRERALEAQLEMTRIQTPITGIIENITVKKGAMALPGLNLLHIVDLRELYVNADISESYLGKIKPGDMVNITFPAYPDFEIKSKIHRIGNVINPENRTVKIQMKVKNQKEILKPNNLVVIKLVDFSTDQALLVPSIVIKKDMQGEYIYIATKEEDLWIAKKTYITTGLSEGNITMVKSGLSPDQKVIIQGYNLVKNNLAIKLDRP
ncbi:MAG: efflux RND transporter periplasmic adaptor subunit [Candidatus Aminicenantes bacterium]|nr:efflux RND transporter periplasmic adaptor subunit [Candidatus Aminicenantes bacterium]